MICPKCNSNTRVTDNHLNPNENERYRSRVCCNKKCQYRFFTAEFIVENDIHFRNQWLSTAKPSETKKKEYKSKDR